MSVQSYLAARTSSGQGGPQPLSLETILDASQVDELDETTKVEAVDITEREEKQGDRPVITLTASVVQAKAEKGKYDEYAIILRRRLDKDRNTMEVKLEIRSVLIRKGIQQVFGDYPYLNLLGCPITIKKPYMELFHFRKELHEYTIDEARTSDERQHMEVLTTFMKHHLGETERAWSQLVPKGLISFTYLWTLFRPGEIVVEQNSEIRQCFQVISAEEKVKEEGFCLQLKCYGWDFNGYRFGRTTKKIKIWDFSGVRKITELGAYPITQLPQDEQKRLRSELIARGHKWRGLVSVGHREYDGIATIYHRRPKENKSYYSHLEPNENIEVSALHVSGRVVLDYATFSQANHMFMPALDSFGLPVDTDIELKDCTDPEEQKKVETERARRSGIGVLFLHKKSYVPSDLQALLSPSSAKGFSLVEKTWGTFVVDKVRDIEWAPQAFDKLEIDMKSKDIIQSLVKRHQTRKFDDVIPGKGKGLIFLLYGPPGSGKTLTAETIAEKTQKPLYWVTSGELGTEVTATDTRLRTIFGLAKAWDAILLLDEADVFLAQRTQTDIVRNAFVSIFLRSIEYYQGILFLTTNRREEFDEAFQSRIHLSLYYPALDETRRAHIWKNLLEGEPTEKRWGTETYEKFARMYNLNGREIKNLIATAVAISAQMGGKLSEEMVDMVYNLNQNTKVS